MVSFGNNFNNTALNLLTLACLRAIAIQMVLKQIISFHYDAFQFDLEQIKRVVSEQDESRQRGRIVGSKEIDRRPQSNLGCLLNRITIHAAANRRKGNALARIFRRQF